VIPIADVLRVAAGWIERKLGLRRQRAEILEAVGAELRELRFLLALVVSLIHTKLRTMNQSALDLIRPVILKYRGDAGDQAYLEATKALLAKGDAAFIAIHNATPINPGKALYPVPYAAQVLTGHLGELGRLPESTRAPLLRIARELELYNEQVAQVRTAHDRTFDSSLSAVNYAANEANLKAGTEKLAMRAARLIEAINEVVDPHGRLR